MREKWFLTGKLKFYFQKEEEGGCWASKSCRLLQPEVWTLHARMEASPVGVMRENEWMAGQERRLSTEAPGKIKGDEKKVIY